MELFKLLGTIAVNGSEAEREIDDVTNSAQNAESRLSQMVGVASGIGKAVATGVATVSAAIVGIGIASLKAGEQANSTLGAIAAQTGQTQDQLRGTEREVRRLASTTGAFTAQEMRDGLAAVSRYGQTTEHQTHMLSSALRLAQATGNYFGKSIKNLDALMVKFNADTEDAVKFVNMFATAQGLAGLSNLDLKKGLQKAAPIVNQAALAYDFVAATLSKAYMEGFNMTQAANGMTNVFQNMLDPTSDLSEVMTNLGIRTQYANGEFRDNETVMWELANALNGLDEEARRYKMASLGLTQYGEAMLDMFMQNGDAVNDLTDSFAYGIEQGYDYSRVLHMIDQRGGGFTEGFQRMRNVLRNVLYAINDVIGSRFYEWMNEAASELEGFITHAKENGYIEQMAESIISIVEAAVELTKQIIPIVVEWLPKLINLSLDITQFLGENATIVLGLWAAFKGYKILKPVIGIFGSLKAAVVALKGKKAIGGLAPAMDKAVGAKGGKGVLGGAGKLVKAIGPKGWAVAAIAGGTVAAIRYVNNQRQSIEDDMTAMYIHTGSKTAAMAYAMAQNMGRMSERASTKMSELMHEHGHLFDEMYAKTGDKSQAMAKITSQHFGELKNKATSRMGEMESNAASAWERAANATDEYTAEMYRTTARHYEKLARQAASELRALEQEYQYYGEALPAGMEKGLRRGEPNVFTAIGDFANGIGERFRSFFGINSPSTRMDKYGQGMGQGAANGIEATINLASKAANRMSESIRGAWDGMSEHARSSGRSMVNGLVNGINSMVGAATSAASNLVGRVRDFLPSSPAKIGPLSDLDKLDFGGPITDSLDGAYPDVQRRLESLLKVPDITPTLQSRANNQGETTDKSISKMVALLTEFINLIREGAIGLYVDGEELGSLQEDVNDRNQGNRQKWADLEVLV